MRWKVSRTLYSHLPSALTFMRSKMRIPPLNDWLVWMQKSFRSCSTQRPILFWFVTWSTGMLRPNLHMKKRRTVWRQFCDRRHFNGYRITSNSILFFLKIQGVYKSKLSWLEWISWLSMFNDNLQPNASSGSDGQTKLSVETFNGYWTMRILVKFSLKVCNIFPLKVDGGWRSEAELESSLRPKLVIRLQWS